MRTVDYSEILYGSAALAGFGKGDLGAPEFALFRTFHDRRLQVAWEIHRWPELCPVEQRQFRANWSALTTYGVNTDPTADNSANEVFDPPTRTYYQSLQPGNVNQPPTAGGVVNGLWWAACANAYCAADWLANTVYAAGTQVRNPNDNRFYQNYATVLTLTAPYETTAQGQYRYDPVQDLFFGPTVYTISPPDNPPVTVAPGNYVLASARNTIAQTILATSPDLVTWTPMFSGPYTTQYATPGIASGSDGWGLLTPFNKYIAWEQPGETPVGEFLATFDKDPRVTTKLTRYRPWLSTLGAQYGLPVPAQVWLYFRLRRPGLTGDAWDSTASYAASDQAYFAAVSGGKGNFYTANQGTAPGESPASAPAKWDVVALPYFLRGYLLEAGFADWLMSDGQSEKAESLEDAATEYLELEADKVQRQQGQVARFLMTCG